jgi:hypothetical protein
VPADPAIVKFVAYAYSRNAHLLPAGSWKRQLGPRIAYLDWINN